MMTENQRAREPDGSERTRRCGACGETKPDTAALFYTLLGKTTARCRVCGKGGTRPGTGGARQGAGRKATALADESGHLVTRVEIGDRAPIELPAGAMMCATCQRVLPVGRFKAPMPLLTKGTKVRRVWTSLPYCDACRRRHRNGKLRGRPMEKGARGPARRGEAGGGAGSDRRLFSSERTTPAARKCPESFKRIDDSSGNHRSSPTRPRNLPALAAALEPIIGPWPATEIKLERALYRVSEKVGLDDIEPGRQPRVHPIVRKGKVQVLDAPDYIQPILIHALPRPELSEHLGSVAVIRSVPENASPAPGHYWYVIVTVPGLGRRLRLWDATDWPWTEKMKATDWEAFISWWNAGVDAGWGTFSHLNEADLSLFFGDAPADTPPSVLARLKRTPALTAWLKEEPTSTSPTEVAKEKNA